MSFRISNYSYHIINSLCNKSETLISRSFLLNMNRLTKKNRILNSSKFLYNELPIRLSRRIKELEKLPIDLDRNHEIFKIRDWYVKSIDELTNVKKPDSLDDCEKYKIIIKNIYNRHSSTLVTMANGISKLRNANLVDDNIDDFLLKFYSNRTRTRFLISNYLHYFDENVNNIGIIDKKCNLKNLINEAVIDINSMAEMHRIDCPNINIKMIDSNIIYPSEYLYYCIIEIMKNSLVATIHKKKPKIDISCLNDNNLSIIKIKDNGKGICEEDKDKIWKFSYTTTKINYENKFSNDFERTNPLSGFGYGLPISKILLNTFSSDIKIYSKPNIGTETYILIDHQNEWKF